MAAKPKLNSNLVALRNDASRVIDDIQKLSAALKTTGRDRVETARADVIDALETQLETLKERLVNLTDTIQTYAMQVDKHVTANPYPYMAGATGIGFLIGRFFKRD
jgi:ElaB/YqjD/DUF883 family membrane-anchored ribosome-binding protein